MTASTDRSARPEPAQTDDPAKGGAISPRQTGSSSGDSPKPQGDKLRHAVAEAAARKTSSGKSDG